MFFAKFKMCNNLCNESSEGIPALCLACPLYIAVKYISKTHNIMCFATQCKAKTNFYFSWQGFCQVNVLNMAKSLTRKVKVGFSFALCSQPLMCNNLCNESSEGIPACILACVYSVHCTIHNLQSTQYKCFLLTLKCAIICAVK